MKQKLLSILSYVFFIGIIQAQTDFITNGSFETGDLGDWEISAVNATDGGAGSCTKNWAVDTNSANTCCCVDDFDPTDGSFGAFTSFDTAVAQTQWIIEQEVVLPNTINTADVSFDFKAVFDFALGSPITVPRTLEVQLLSSDGNTILSSIFSDEYEGTDLLEIDYTQNVDILDDLEGLEGSTVLLRFTASIEETSTGPGKAMIDNVSFVIDDTLGIDDLVISEQISLFPNPSNGTFTLKYNGVSSLVKGFIYDVSGKIVSKLDLTDFAGSKVIETNLSAGIYLLEVQSNSERKTSKLIIR